MLVRSCRSQACTPKKRSLGGVLALLSGLTLSISNINTNIITFSHPRIGNDDFNKLLYILLKKNKNLKKYIRFYNNNDKVISLPPRQKKDGYKHLDKYIDNNKLNKLKKYEYYNIQSDIINTLKPKYNDLINQKLAHSCYYFKLDNKIIYIL